MDITSLYTSVPQEDSITTVWEWYDKFYYRNLSCQVSIQLKKVNPKPVEQPWVRKWLCLLETYLWPKKEKKILRQSYIVPIFWQIFFSAPKKCPLKRNYWLCVPHTLENGALYRINHNQGNISEDTPHPDLSSHGDLLRSQYGHPILFIRCSPFSLFQWRLWLILYSHSLINFAPPKPLRPRLKKKKPQRTSWQAGERKIESKH